jgi:hypothetical protein
MPADLTPLYNTPLSPEDEAKFQAWIKSSGRERDLADYDLRGAWKADTKEAANGHLPDTWKKPNHPTFSTESVYNGVDGRVGGASGLRRATSPTWAALGSWSNTSASASRIRALSCRRCRRSRWSIPAPARVLCRALPVGDRRWLSTTPP